MRYILLCLMTCWAITTQAQTPTPMPLAPLTEGYYQFEALTAPQIVLSGDWLISVDGRTLTTSQLGATIEFASAGEWIVMDGEIQATVCAPACTPLDHSGRIAYSHTGQVSISNTGITALDALMILQGQVMTTPAPVALIVPPDPSRVYHTVGGDTFAEDRAISTGDKVIVALLVSLLSVALVQVVIALWKR